MLRVGVIPVLAAEGESNKILVRFLDPYKSVARIEPKLFSCMGCSLGVLISHSTDSLSGKVASARVMGPKRADLSLVLPYQINWQKFRIFSITAYRSLYLIHSWFIPKGMDIYILNIKLISVWEKNVCHCLTSKEATEHIYKLHYLVEAVVVSMFYNYFFGYIIWLKFILACQKCIDKIKYYSKDLFVQRKRCLTGTYKTIIFMHLINTIIWCCVYSRNVWYLFKTRLF